MKYIANILVMTVLSLSIWSCSSNASKIKDTVDQINSTCPRAEKNGLKLQSVSIMDGDVVYRYILNEKASGAKKIKEYRKNEDDAQSYIFNQLKVQNNKKQREFLEACKEEDMNLVYRYIGSKSNDSIDFVIVPTDLLK